LRQAGLRDSVASSQHVFGIAKNCSRYLDVVVIESVVESVDVHVDVLQIDFDDLLLKVDIDIDAILENSEVSTDDRHYDVLNVDVVEDVDVLNLDVEKTAAGPYVAQLQVLDPLLCGGAPADAGEPERGGARGDGSLVERAARQYAVEFTFVRRWW